MFKQLSKTETRYVYVHSGPHWSGISSYLYYTNAKKKKILYSPQKVGDLPCPQRGFMNINQWIPLNTYLGD